jgi:glycerate 2-kinase
MRIQNMAALAAQGNQRGRRALLDILEAGLQAADPYNNARQLLRVEGRRLIVGHADFVPAGSPKSGEEVFDLDALGRIYVVGAGKGSQRVAKAIEEVLGDRLTGGHVIDKCGGNLILQHIGVTFGAHPVPDEGCVRGCEQILALLHSLHKEDLVFTIAANGVSALLTMPVPGVSLDDVRRTTYLMQIERGAPTGDLNSIRSHLDQMKGGRISAYLQPATAIHIIAIDPGSYDQLMHRNLWLHNLPDCTTFDEAVRMLEKWHCWDKVPASVRAHLTRADPHDETVKAEAFERTSFRIFGVMPERLSMVPSAQRKAAELGYTPHTLATGLSAEASQAGLTVAAIASTIEQRGQPFEPPCALFSTGELLVTVGEETGIGGRNQEFALSAALRIAGSRNIVIGGVDSDGTDGPGTQFAAPDTLQDCGETACLAGGLVDGDTVSRAREVGVDIHAELRKHNASPALRKLGGDIVAEHNISIGDLGVVLIMGRS